MSFVLGLLLGVFLGAGGMWVFQGCVALHKAFRDAMDDLRP